MVILLFWFYVSSLLILVGAEINSMADGEAEIPGQSVTEVAVPIPRVQSPSAGIGWTLVIGMALALFAWSRRRGPNETP